MRFSSASLTGNSRGVTLAELMIATAVISIGILGLMGGFAGMQKALQGAKGNTMASNLAQEKMQILKQLPYFQVLVTTAPSFNYSFTPNIAYDPGYFPPETILEGGISYQRLTNIQVVTDNNGTITVLAPTTPDTGLRMITVTVVWTQGGSLKQLAINSVLSNPNTVETDSYLTGVIKDSTTHQPIQGALINIAENTAWTDTSKADGTYTINVVPGSFDEVITAPGYFTQRIPFSIAANQSQPQSPFLLEMASGSVTGFVWFSTNVVISQVVVSTFQINSNYDVEYIELFNPTWSTITMNNGSVNLNIMSEAGNAVSGGGHLECSTVTLRYNNPVILPQHYYIIANTTTFTINGSSYNQTGTPAEVDAYYSTGTPGFPITSPCSNSALEIPINWSVSPSSTDILQRGHSNTVYLSSATGMILDAVGWTNGGVTHNPSLCAGTCIPQPSGGLPSGQQIVRISSPANTGNTMAFANGVSSGWGRAYDTALIAGGGNIVDFAFPGSSTATMNLNAIKYSPFSSNQRHSFDVFYNSAPAALSSMGLATYTVSGIPAVGAVVTSNDGISNFAVANTTSPFPAAFFNLTQVSTGTTPNAWTILITSNNFTLENDTVCVQYNGYQYIFPSSTTILASPTLHGFISGTVTDIFGNPITVPNAVWVTPGNNAGVASSASTSNGRYLLRVSTGLVDTFANAQGPNFNYDYVMASSLTIPVGLGELHDGVNFMLSQGGRLSGFITRDGINALPGVLMSVSNIDGYTADSEITNYAGNFITVNVPTGTYTVAPQLDSLEVSNPVSMSTNVSIGANVFSGTWTITGALGTITGSVTSGGHAITTGVLIVVTTVTLLGSPPALPVLNAAAQGVAPYYATSSLENGTYSVNVRQSTFTVYGYFPQVGATGAVTIKSLQLANVIVNSGQVVPNENFAW
jgi:hypothetical protein